MISRTVCLSLLLIFSTQTYALDPIVTESTATTKIHTSGDMTTTVKSPPPSAISPTFSAGSNSDLCTVGIAGAVQTQILGISAGSTVRDMNCERLKNSKTLYDMGMKVAAVSVLCQDIRVFDAMLMAGTPCPYHGIIGADARIAWQNDDENRPKEEDEQETGFDTKEILGGIGSAILGLLLFI